MKAKKSSCKTAAKRKPRTKASSEGIAPAVFTEKPAPAPKPAGYVFGRPTDYDPSYVEQARKLYAKGWTDIEVADFFGVSDRTLYRWMATHEDFCQAIKLGKEAPDDRTERSLYHRANGFEWIEQQAIKLKEVTWEDGNKVERERVEVVDVRKRVPPDTTASIFWLSNRRKDKWRQKVEHTGEGGGAIQHQHAVQFHIVDPNHQG